MLKSISQLVIESKDPVIRDLTSSKPTYICADCMNGYHEVSGNTTCNCACHNNPSCFVCGDVLCTPELIKAGVHFQCECDWNEQQEYKRLTHGI